MVNIHFNSLDSQNEKCVQQELSYDSVISNSMHRRLKSAKDLYTTVILLIALERQRQYEIRLSSRTEDQIIISIVPTVTDDPDSKDFDIKWSVGK